MSFLSPGRGSAQRPAQRYRPPRPTAAEPASRLGRRRDGRDAARRRPRSAPAGMAAAGRAPRGAHRRRAGARPGGAGERLGVLWLTPQMDRLFVEGPEGRRRLLDRLVLGARSGACGAGRAATSRRCASARGCCATARTTRPGWPRSKRSWPTEGVAVAAARRDAIERLDRVCAEARGRLSARPAGACRHGRGLARRRCRRWPPRSASRGAGR